jgi:1,4-dihydroxy-6-naphthoate synthase
MRRDLGEPMHRALAEGLRRSIAWAHANVDEALGYAMRYSRGIDRETCRRFVLVYVNDRTLRLGDEGHAALKRLFSEAHRRGFLPAMPPLDSV